MMEMRNKTKKNNGIVNFKKNGAIMIGTIAQIPRKFCETADGMLYVMVLAVARNSGVIDEIYIMLNSNMLYEHWYLLQENARVCIYGRLDQYKGLSKIDKETLYTVVMAQTIEPADCMEDLNEVYLDACIQSKSGIRYTKGGRNSKKVISGCFTIEQRNELMDIFFVAWNGCAEFIQYQNVGDSYHLFGRLYGRKRNTNMGKETIYEVAVCNIRQKENLLCG